MQIDIPDTTTLTMTAAEYAAKMDMAKQDATRQAVDELDALKAERAAMVDALNLGDGDNAAIAVQAVITERDNAVKERNDLDRVYDAFRSGIVEQLDIPDEANIAKAINGLLVIAADRDKLVIENAALKARIAELTKLLELPDDPMPDTQPVITIPDPVVVLPKPALKNVRGILITKDDAPTPRQDETTRDLIDLCGKMGFTHWRGLLNFEEVAKQRKLPASDPANLPAYGRAHGMAYVADSVDSQMKRLTDPDAIKTYFEGLKELEAVAVFFDDVDKAEKAPFIHDWLRRARAGMKAANFKVPLTGSFTANVKRGVYDVDQIEIQTYGSLSNFKDFLTRDADFLCIDGRAKATPEYIDAMTKLVASNRRDFFVYAAKSRDGTNWLNTNMVETVSIYGKFMDGLKG